MKLGILFAGQGSQSVGMGADFYGKSEQFRSVFDLLPQEQRNVAFEGPVEALSDTRNTQPIMVAFAAGVLRELLPALSDLGVTPAMAAGLSLGEYSALHSAGVFDAKTAIELVTKRANAMAKAAEGVDCAMKAVLGLDREALAGCCAAAAECGTVQIANYNCPGQIVIAGERGAVEKAAELALEAGAKRCVALPVSGPFHTCFMEPAGHTLAEIFADTAFGEMRFPVLFNAVGREKRLSETIGDLLVKQVSGSVYFEDTIKTMAAAGVDTIIEIGPGKALSGFVRKTDRSIKVLNIETWDDLQKVLEELKAAKGGAV
ncbi:ACP S-malonyltransferase [Anaerovoracaceae bacterium 42-11]